jgi:hypothetical protein
MGKSEQRKRNDTAARSLPYGRAKSSNVFKFDTSLGQHILKNPGGQSLSAARSLPKKSDVLFSG